MVVIEVSDNGPGVPDDIRQIMFEFGVSRSGGTGIGLARTFDLVNQHDGSITYDFRDGAHFTIRLPMAAEEAASA